MIKNSIYFHTIEIDDGKYRELFDQNSEDDIKDNDSNFNENDDS